MGKGFRTTRGFDIFIMVATWAAIATFVGGFAHWRGRQVGFQQGVNATIPEASKQCAVLTVATFRNATRMLEAKNRQAELAIQREANR